MNTLKKNISQLKQKPAYAKVLHWGKLVSITGAAQVIVQAVGFIGGILVIRLLPVEEYALYTLANTMLGTMTILADGGISSGVMAQGGKVWNHRDKLGTVLATGLDLRRKFAIFSLVVFIPILLYLLLHHGSSWLTAIMIAISLIPAFYAALSDGLLQIIPKLQQNIAPLQKNQVMVGLGRLALLGLTLFVYPFAVIALLAGGIPRILGNIKLRKLALPYAAAQQKPDLLVRKEIISVVRRIMPASIYFALSGQITIWLISIFGNTQAVAGLGAIGRISTLVTLFSVIISTLVTPRFARIENLKQALNGFVVKVLFMLLGIGVPLILLTFLFSTPLLKILGTEYLNYKVELTLNILVTWVGLVAGTLYGLYTSKGWMVKPLIYIPLHLLVLICGIMFFDLTTIVGVLYVNLLMSIYQVILNLFFIFYQINQEAKL